MVLGVKGTRFCVFLTLLFIATFIGKSNASLGDRLPEFRECVKVRTNSRDSALPALSRPFCLMKDIRSVKMKTAREGML